MTEKRSKIMDDLIAQDADLIDIEPVAYRYGFDGYGWQYIDNGSGSDWTIRYPDGEPLYAHPPADRIEALSAENERLREALMLCAKHVDWMPHPHCVEVEAAIRAALGDTK